MVEFRVSVAKPDRGGFGAPRMEGLMGLRETVATARYGIPPWVDPAIGVGILYGIGAGCPGKR